MEKFGKIWKNLEKFGKIWKNLEKFGKIWKNLFLPPMRGSCPGTLLSSRMWEVQFQDIVIELVHTNTIVQHMN